MGQTTPQICSFPLSSYNCSLQEGHSILPRKHLFILTELYKIYLPHSNGKYGSSVPCFFPFYHTNSVMIWRYAGDFPTSSRPAWGCELGFQSVTCSIERMLERWDGAHLRQKKEAHFVERNLSGNFRMSYRKFEPRVCKCLHSRVAPVWTNVAVPNESRGTFSAKACYLPIVCK